MKSFQTIFQARIQLLERFNRRICAPKKLKSSSDVENTTIAA
jgi:hypothetical protein